MLTIGKCPICGKPSDLEYGRESTNGFCRRHAADYKAWRLDPVRKNSEPYIIQQSEVYSECQICGGYVFDGKPFCRACYMNYTDEELLYILNRILEEDY